MGEGGKSCFAFGKAGSGALEPDRSLLDGEGSIFVKMSDEEEEEEEEEGIQKKGTEIEKVIETLKLFLPIDNQKLPKFRRL